MTRRKDRIRRNNVRSSLSAIKSSFFVAKCLHRRQSTTCSALLSVDLGLRSGFAIYDNEGTLTTAFGRRFESQSNIDASINEVLVDVTRNYSITHYVLEGDNVLQKAWREAIATFIGTEQTTVEIITVSPAEWRAQMLMKKEAESGSSAKAAARLIARQIMWRAGLVDEYSTKPMDTDVAEAILIGYYATRTKLNWTGEDKKKNPYQTTLVERYSNGNVVLPPKRIKKG